MVQPRDTIRNYNLFGETGALPDVVHCETIEARSRLHDWELRPHRHARLYQVLLIETGGGRADLDGRTASLGPGMVASIPAGHVHGFSFVPGTQGWVVTLTADLVDGCLRGGEGVRPLLAAPRLMPCPPDLRRLVRRIFAEYDGKGFARAQVLRSQAGALIGLVARAAMAAEDAAEAGRVHPLLPRFEALVDARFRERLPVAAYARALAVSPTHLNRVVRQATGRPASALIAERVLREARRLLIYTSLSAAEIGYELGYNDPAHFSRVFARGTGMPPRRFRQRLEGHGGHHGAPAAPPDVTRRRV